MRRASAEHLLVVVFAGLAAPVACGSTIDVGKVEADSGAKDAGAGTDSEASPKWS